MDWKECLEKRIIKNVRFDKIRNSINYYGKKIPIEDSKKL